MSWQMRWSCRCPVKGMRSMPLARQPRAVAPGITHAGASGCWRSASVQGMHTWRGQHADAALPCLHCNVHLVAGGAPACVKGDHQRGGAVSDHLLKAFDRQLGPAGIEPDGPIGKLLPSWL